MNVVGCIRGTTLHGALGGMELAAKKLYEGLASKGASVTVLSSALKKEQKEIVKLSESGVSYVFLPSVDVGKYSTEYHRSLAQYFEENLINTTDIIHSTSAGASSITQNSKNIPVVATWHGTLLEQELDKVYKYQYLDAKSLRPTNVERLVIATILPRMFKTRAQYLSYSHHVGISEYMSTMLKLYGIEDKKVSTIPNSVGNNFFNVGSQNSIEDDIGFKKTNKYVLGTVGRAVPEKGHKIFVEALQLLDRDKYEVILVGAGPEASLYDSVQQNVTTLKLPHTKMPMAYKQMDLFVNPTVRLSGFDLTVLESLATNVRVLNSDLPQYKEFLDFHSFNKINNRMSSFSTGDPRDLADAIESIFINNSPLNSASNENKGILSDEQMIREYLSLFDSLI